MAGFKDGVIQQIPRHLPLIPPLADHHQTVRSPIIVEEDEMFLSFMDGLAECGVSRRFHGCRKFSVLNSTAPILAAVLVNRL